jgi:DNA-binding transcriptional ArsR family regulator
MTKPVYEAKAEFFKVLGHPARIRVLEVLRDGERSVGDLVPEVGIESSHLSQQLGVMRRAKLVQARKVGSTVFYSTSRGGSSRRRWRTRRDCWTSCAPRSCTDPKARGVSDQRNVAPQRERPPMRRTGGLSSTSLVDYFSQPGIAPLSLVVVETLLAEELSVT